MASPNKTRVQVATDPAFSNIVHDVEGAYTTALQVAEEVLPQGVNLYARGMHGHPTTGDSSWSTTVQFQIKLAWSTYNGSADGMPITLNNYNSSYFSILEISENKFSVMYHGFDGLIYNAYNQIVSISGSTITSGEIVKCFNFDIAGTWRIFQILLGGDRIFISTRNNSYNGWVYARILSIDNVNNKVIPNPSVQCNSAYSYSLVPFKVSDTKVIIFFGNANDNYYLYSKMLTISGTTISVGSAVQGKQLAVEFFTILELNSGKLLMISKYFNYDPLYVRIGTINGDNVTFGSDILLAEHAVSSVRTLEISENRVCVIYKKSIDSSYWLKLLNIQNDTITVHHPGYQLTNYNSASFYFNSLDENRIIVGITEVSDRNYLNVYVVDLGDTSVNGVTVASRTVTDIDFPQIIKLPEFNKLLLFYQNKANSNSVTGKILVDN